MKKLLKRIDPALTILADALLIALAVLAVPCCVLSAYRVPFSVRSLAWAAVLIGGCLSVWMHVPKKGYLAGVLYFAIWTPLLLYWRGAIRYGFELFRYAMLDLLSPDVPFLSAPTPIDPAIAAGLSQTTATVWFTMLVMVLFGMPLAWSLIRSKMLILPVIVPLPLFMLSLIYTDLPIAHWAVLLLMLYLGTCLITGGLRVNESPQYGTVAAVMVLLLLLLGTLIRAVSPPETYEPISFEQRQEMIGERVQQLYDDVTNLMNNRVKRTEDLSDEEEWKRTDDVVLCVAADTAGTQYLRAYSLGGYRNNAWESVPNNAGDWNSLAALGERSRALAQFSMQVRAEDSEMLYAPYGGTSESVTEWREAFLPARGETEYAWSYANVIPPAATVTEAEAEYYSWAQSVYTIEDGAEKAALLDYCAAAGLEKQSDNYATARAVAAYVQSSATYSTTPGKIPAGSDFVLYFLTESREGYCVHFASATTALLQAMDIPARYVFGYRFATAAGEWQDVTDEMAHAWTEVYCPGIGWLPVESTAGAEGWKEPGATDSPTDAPTTPEPTVEPTEAPTPKPSEMPTESDQPMETPVPSALPTDTPTDAPEQTTEQHADGQTDPARNLLWLLWLLVPPALALAVWGAGRIARQRREQRFRQKDARAAVLAMYRYQKRLERFGAPVSEEAFALAEEATFSHHAMQEGRKRMQAILNHSKAALGKQPRWKQFLYKYLLFL